MLLQASIFVVGGMPEAVEVWTRTQSFAKVRTVQKSVLADYDDDFKKHAPKELLPKIRLLWNNIPAQLAKENRKFVYTALKPEYFRRVNAVEFLGRKWYGYGNASLLKLPVLEPFRCSRTWAEGGGRWIVLSPEGFGERWHPGRQYEKFCAEGRMLFLSLWPARAREPSNAELYERCHTMGDIVIEGLSEERSV